MTGENFRWYFRALATRLLNLIFKSQLTLIDQSEQRCESAVGPS